MMNDRIIEYIYNGKKQITILPRHNQFRPWYTEENFLVELRAAFKSAEEQLQQQKKKSMCILFRQMYCMRSNDDTQDTDDIKNNDVHNEAECNVLIDIRRKDDATVLVDIKYADRHKGNRKLFGKAISAFYTGPAVVKSGAMHHLLSSVPSVH